MDEPRRKGREDLRGVESNSWRNVHFILNLNEFNRHIRGERRREQGKSTIKSPSMTLFLVCGSFDQTVPVVLKVILAVSEHLPGKE